MNIQSLLVALIVLVAVAFVVRRLWGTVRGGNGTCGCGDKRGCARMNEAMRSAGMHRR